MENSSEKRRGRPGAFPPKLMGLLAHEYGEGGARSRRHVVDSGYYLRAFKLLSEAPGGWHRYDWLWWDGRVRRALLTELGRIEHDADVLEMAALLCERKPRTRDATAQIRQWRLGREAAGTADQLGNELARTIDAYRVRYPGTSLTVVLDALDGVRRTVAELSAAPSEGEQPS